MWPLRLRQFVKVVCVLYCAGFSVWVAYVLLYAAAAYPGTAAKVLNAVPLYWIVFFWSLVAASFIRWHRYPRGAYMRPCSKTYRLAVWSGLVTSALLLTLWSFSAYWFLHLVVSLSPLRVVSIRSGCFEYYRCSITSAVIDPRWSVDRSRIVRLVDWPPRVTRALGPPSVRVQIPLWIPFLIAVAPTGVLWWRAHPFPAGHCQKCGYDLTGNVSGRCPECGSSLSDGAQIQK